MRNKCFASIFAKIKGFVSEHLLLNELQKKQKLSEISYI